MAEPTTPIEKIIILDDGYNSFHERLRLMSIDSVSIDAFRSDLNGYSVSRNQQIGEKSKSLQMLRKANEVRIAEFQKVRRYSMQADGLISAFQAEQDETNKLLAEQIMLNEIQAEALKKLLGMVDAGLKKGWGFQLTTQMFNTLSERQMNIIELFKKQAELIEKMRPKDV